MTIMEDGGFTMVSSKKSAKRVRMIRETQRGEGTVEDIERVMKITMEQMEGSGLSDWLISRVGSLLENRKVCRISVIGNGHFDASWEPGAHQLALAMQIQKYYEAEMIFQEPCCSSAEREYLSNQSSVVLREESTLRVPVAENGDVEIVFFIHGLHGLLNDLLWYNWQLAKLRNVMFVINDYSDIGLIGGTVALNAEHEALDSYRKVARFDVFPSYANHPEYFMNTALVYLENDIDTLEKIAEKEPVYSSVQG